MLAAASFSSTATNALMRRAGTACNAVASPLIVAAADCSAAILVSLSTICDDPSRAQMWRKAVRTAASPLASSLSTAATVVLRYLRANRSVLPCAAMSAAERLCCCDQKSIPSAQAFDLSRFASLLYHDSPSRLIGDL